MGTGKSDIQTESKSVTFIAINTGVGCSQLSHIRYEFFYTLTVIPQKIVLIRETESKGTYR